jgi:hypothetical protein
MPEGVRICIHADSDREVRDAADTIVTTMVDLGIATLLNPDPSFTRKTVTILVGTLAID